MTWIGIVIRLIPVVIKLMTVAESLLGSGTGQQKKTYVLNGVRAIFEGAERFTEGQEDLWNKIEAAISPLVDIACTFLFANDDK